MQLLHLLREAAVHCTPMAPLGHSHDTHADTLVLDGADHFPVGQVLHASVDAVELDHLPASQLTHTAGLSIVVAF